jgi:dGTPase
VTDLIRHSCVDQPGKKSDSGNFIGFSSTISDALKELKQFNYKYIYLAPETKKYLPMVQRCYHNLFDYYLQHLENNTVDRLTVDLMGDLEEDYTSSQPAAARVRDFIAGMTDDFFINQATLIGCEVPVKQ